MVVISLFFFLVEGNIKNTHLWGKSVFCKIIVNVANYIPCLLPKSELDSGSGSEAGTARMCLWTEHGLPSSPGPGMTRRKSLFIPRLLRCWWQLRAKEWSTIWGNWAGLGTGDIFYAFKISPNTSESLGDPYGGKKNIFTLSEMGNLGHRMSVERLNMQMDNSQTIYKNRTLGVPVLAEQKGIWLDPLGCRFNSRSCSVG